MGSMGIFRAEKRWGAAMTKLHEQVLKRRVELGLTRRDVVQRVMAMTEQSFKVTPGALSEYEAGRIERPRYLHELLRVLDLPSPSAMFDTGSHRGLDDRSHQNDSGLSELSSGLAVRLVPVVGMVSAGTWMEAMEQQDVTNIPFVPDPRFVNLEQYGLRVLGQSVNKIARDGEVVICVPYFMVRSALSDGDLVHVERRRGELVEGTVKRLRLTPAGPILEACSDDPRHQGASQLTPDGLSDAENDTIEIEVRGLVIAAHRSLVA